MIHTILLEPENEGNIGAVARVMDNFGCTSLILISPKCNHLSETAVKRAKHAKSILRKARVEKKSYLGTVDCLIGTTAKLGTDYNLPRSPLTPSQLAEVLPKSGEVALLFGREGIGLTNQEVKMCDFVVHIPTARYKTLNISHAVAILLYDIHRKKAMQHLQKRFAPAGKKEKQLLLKRINGLLSKMEFTTSLKEETQRLVWRRLINKSFMTKREAFALFGFLKKLEKQGK